MADWNKTNKPSDNDKTIYDWAMNLVEDGRARRAVHEGQWWENICTYNGDLWAEWDVTLSKLVETNKPDFKVRIPVNLAQPAIRTEYAKLLKNRPIVDCMARSNDRADLNSAEVGDKLLGHYIEKQLHMPKHRRRMLQWALITGMGGIFCDYDDQALGEQEVLMGPDGEPVFDLNMIKAVQRHYREKKKAPKTMLIKQGELRHRGVSPFQIMWDFSELELEDAWWCIVSEVYDVDEVWRRWGVEVEGDHDTKPGIMQRRTIERWDLTTNPQIEWAQGTTQQLVEVHRLFVRPGHRWFPDGLEAIYTDIELIAHNNFPYKHGFLPLGVCGHVPQPMNQYQESIIPQIKPIILEISKTESQLVENRNLMSNPPWLIFRQSQISGEIVNRPGARIIAEWMPNIPPPAPIQMPEIPQYVKDLIPIMKEHVLEISGQSEISQGKVPTGARSGVTISYLQEEDDTKLGPTVQSYEEAMERVAWMDLQNIAQFYDVPRTIRIYKKHSEPEVFDFIGTMLEGIAGVHLQSGSALPRSKAAKQQFILDLWDRKLEQDPRKVREMLELSEGEPDEWEKDINQAERENRKMLLGNPVPVKEWQNHPAHHYQHRDFMKSPEFDDLDAKVQQVMEAHDEEHSRFERQQAQQAMVMQAMGTGPANGAAPGAPTEGGANGVTATPPPEMAPQESGATAQAAGPALQDVAPQ